MVVDMLTKYAHFIGLKHLYTTAIMVQTYIDHVLKLHGLPTTIVSDRDLVFTSQFWRELFKIQGVALHMSTAYHLETNGQTKVVNRCEENYLRCIVEEQPTTQGKWLLLVEWWYNSTYYSAINLTQPTIQLSTLLFF